ncbi:hypothetical protein GGX14DRAFT_694087 [Mycena pura]|uniref:Protein Zds1 C-terminal domain-containing protein n=1 Tax=Mycena pura TaxID=153505 RepID=A0AAD6YN11_9AGAR|nr:hypothetical protein GGX14DRAFT_694087 [Mycena pura]
MSQLLNTQLDKETLTTCVRMIESGVNAETLAAVIHELRRKNAPCLPCTLPFASLFPPLYDSLLPTRSSAAVPSMQPSEYDIRREVEALRDIRRRSTTPGALTLDPDLPPNQGSPSPTSPYLPQDPSTSAAPDPAPTDPLHLFWVPASLHPEIAPAEFRAFLKEHARNPPSDDDPSVVQRASSISSVSSGLSRKKSMLSRQYTPSETDSGDETVVPLRRNRSGIFSSNQNQGPQLTISDLQKLEELAEEASSSDDPAKLRSILRRSLSLNVSPLALDTADPGDEADQPIVVAPPGQFLRRTARTRIRKPGLPGDGGGHRFGERRRGPSARSATSPGLQRTSSDVSSSDHGDSGESLVAAARLRTFSDEGSQDRPNSFSEEAQIYDAYARDDEDESPAPVLPPVVITSSPPSDVTEFTAISPHPELPPPPQPEPPQPAPALLEALTPVIHQPQPTRLLSPSPSDPYQTQHAQPPSRTPSPSDASPTSTPNAHGATAPPPTNSPPSSSFLSMSPSPRKDKDKKGLFGKWGSDKEKEKAGKANKKERERLEKEQREKDSGFFGSLFGKKKHDAPPETSGLHGGREAAQALLGQSQRAPRSPGPPSPMMGQGMMGGAGGNNYSRYPIHVERAIYRLSHIKLANPRRPLYEQVLISNLMFWYLGVINKAQAGAQGEQPAAGGGVNGQTVSQAEGEKEKLDRERTEREAQERAEKERVERERLEREQREREQWEREMEIKKRESSPRRGALTKAPPPGGPQQRRAEMPVKGPQYEMQHRVMEKEYAGYNGNVPMRSNIPPGPGAGSGQGYPRQPQSPPSPNFTQQPVNVQGSEQYYFSPGEVMQQQQQSRLPPGAMAPASVDQSTWLAGRPHSGSPPPMNAPQRRSRSPPPPGMKQQAMPVYNPDGKPGGARLGGRSLSATAISSQSMMNGKIRKGQSAHVGMPSNTPRPRTADMPPPLTNGSGGGEEEDMPLATFLASAKSRCSITLLFADVCQR